MPTLKDRARAHTPTREQQLWHDYLHTCSHAINYEDIEPWAWTLLQHGLEEIKNTPRPAPATP